MDRLRSAWFESRHLDAGAPALRAELQALDPDARAAVLAVGDRLAAVSLTLAQQYCRRAPAAWRLGGGTFRRWVRHGEALATEEPASREAAAAYFALAPGAIAALPEGELEAWLVLARRALDVSRRLGELFVAGSGPLLAELTDRARRLEAWVGAGLALAAEGSWESDLLTLHFFESTALALPLFAPEDYGAWAELGRVASRLGPTRPELFISAPTALHRLAEHERGVAIDLALAAAAAPAIAVELYFSLPAVLDAVPEERDAVVASLRPVACATPRALTELLPVLRTLLERTPATFRGALVALAGEIAARFPAGVVPYYRVLPRLLEQTGVEGVARWVNEGLAVAADGRDPGLAYFALDSRTSRAVLAASSTAIAFTEVQGLVKRYLQMLCGHPVEVAARGDVGYRPPFLADGEGALFPTHVDVFATAEANLRVYRLIAAQHAARREFASAALVPPLAEFIGRFEYPAIAEHLFGIFEGVRLDAALARAYRGLAADLRALAAELTRDAVRLPGTVEQLARVLVQARRDDLAGRLPAVAERLAAASATVTDSARATALVYAEIMRHESGLGLTVGASGFPELFADGSLTDAMLDFDGGDGAALAAALAADDAAEPPPALPDAQPQLDLADELSEGAPGVPLDPAALLRLLEQARDLTIRQGHGDELDALGLYIDDLAGKLPRERMAELLGALRDARGGPRSAPVPNDGAAELLYDEWDYRIGDYRSAWCRLRELPLESDTGDFFHRTLATHADLLPEVRRQFQRIRPERYRVVHGLEDGEDFDLNAVITARADRRSGHPPSSKLYQARQREERDVATLFLVDMSASTDEPVPGAAAGRRVIDITKEALVVMAEALEGIGDAYAIGGFSGHGRMQVEFYVVKRFTEPLTPNVKGRIGAIEPKRSTRMGTALRHATAQIRRVAARSKHVILLSDGFPQDLDYGDDRRSNVYGIQDTMVAFQEAARAGVTPFCITVDKAGHDYLKEICDASRYLVIDDITALPRELPKIYQRCVRP
ncbi:MAG: VWA domain-containing protein [Deltaproteobacteria bacterium]|nr:VWA domain-containing protein [Deltaproteobacteria bacterium]